MPIRSLSSIHFNGSTSQIKALRRLPKDERFNFMLSLTPEQRHELPSSLLVRFYSRIPKRVKVSIHPDHFSHTLTELKALPETKEGTDYKQIMEIWNQLNKENPELVASVAERDPEIKNVKRFEEGISDLMLTVEIYHDHLDSDETDDSESQDKEKKALESLLSFIGAHLKNSDLSPREKLEYLCDLASGGLKCEHGQFTQAYKVYLRLMKCDTPVKRVLKTLHDVRDNLLDWITLRNSGKDEYEETVEEKWELLQHIGALRGMLSSQIVSTSEHEMTEQEKACLIEQGFNLEIIDLVREKRKIEMQQMIVKFDQAYSPDKLVDIIQEQSQDLDLYQWFLAHPPKRFRNHPEGYSEYVQKRILQPNSVKIRKRYIWQLLEEMNVIHITK